MTNTSEILSKRMYIHKDLKSYEKIGYGMLPLPPPSTPPLYITSPRGLALRYYRMNRNILFLDYDLDSIKSIFSNVFRLHNIGKIKFLLFPQGHFSKFKPEDQHNHG